ncbi:molybdenum cofactor biosysynthesis protein [Halobellus salinus]|uniref:Molybdenum cofactor biosysynthesis protein n=1 Tax=Halobellus salinus TaxID=931585 RepID=A0A830EB30_9EURY|nr:MOSC N-terminal beta barrel domain-containing protein [Halobellus salinus]GGI94375.1 molybdenum cofactor biosysynthesis protein [Halobellus salinus]SMP19835.1 hypothetical protein SAMN06265347_10776 [Halobellus salinus]
MARLERLRIYPVKGLDGIDVDTASVRAGGTLGGDREYALGDADNDPLNGKRTAAVHDLNAAFDPESGTLSVGTESRETAQFTLPAERDRASAWFSDVFGDGITLERNEDRGFVDRPGMGPSVVSTATLEAVASWFDGLTVESVRRRLRANVEVSGVPAFWEDRFVGDDAPAFAVGGVRFEGITPCGRCVVPSRDPDTGEAVPAFRRRFVRKRRETFPEFADPDAFEHFFAVMILARVPEAASRPTLRVGDAVTDVNRD